MRNGSFWVEIVAVACLAAVFIYLFRRAEPEPDTVDDELARALDSMFDFAFQSMKAAGEIFINRKAIHPGNCESNFRVDYHANGAVRRYAEYCGGELHGKEATYGTDGHMIRETNWDFGSRHGPDTLYGKLGTPVQITNYRFGVLHGKQQEFYPNGMLKRKWKMRFGDLHGQEVHHDEQGRPLRETNWLFGHKHGPERICSPDQTHCETTHCGFGWCA